MSKRKILVVDDDASLTRLLQASLQKQGTYEVVVENDSRHALQAVRDLRPDLIVLDIVMPNVNGGQIAKAIRGDAALADTPIIFLSSFLSKQEQRARGADGVQGTLLAKPIAIATLIENIEQTLNNQTGSRNENLV